MIEVIKQNFPVLKGLKVAFQANKLTRLTFPQSMIAYYSQILRNKFSLLSHAQSFRSLISISLMRIPSHTTREKNPPPLEDNFDQTVIFHSSLYSCF